MHCLITRLTPLPLEIERVPTVSSYPHPLSPKTPPFPRPSGLRGGSHAPTLIVSTPGPASVALEDGVRAFHLVLGP